MAQETTCQHGACAGQRPNQESFDQPAVVAPQGYHLVDEARRDDVELVSAITAPTGVAAGMHGTDVAGGQVCYCAVHQGLLTAALLPVMLCRFAQLLPRHQLDKALAHDAVCPLCRHAHIVMPVREWYCNTGVAALQVAEDRSALLALLRRI